MHRRRIKRRTKGFFNRVLLLLTISALAAHVFLTGCASAHRRDDSIKSILQKENELIEKLQVERAQPEVAQAVSESESLRKAEAHLSLALEELLRANVAIMTKILKTNKEEEGNGKNQRIND